MTRLGLEACVTDVVVGNSAAWVWVRHWADWKEAVTMPELGFIWDSFWVTAEDGTDYGPFFDYYQAVEAAVNEADRLNTDAIYEAIKDSGPWAGCSWN